uniref:Transmembrane protein n=1 Tax=Triticum urartu TaxID=4572 RepID=A0A8R7PGH8_TRIUA
MSNSAALAPASRSRVAVFLAFSLVWLSSHVLAAGHPDYADALAKSFSSSRGRGPAACRRTRPSSGGPTPPCPTARPQTLTSPAATTTAATTSSLISPWLSPRPCCLGASSSTAGGWRGAFTTRAPRYGG